MSGDDKPGIISMRIMLPLAIAVWAVTFWFVHGPMVFAYLAMHAVTTGVFLTAIYMADRSRAKAEPVQSLRVTPKTNFEPETQAKQAVAG